MEARSLEHKEDQRREKEMWMINDASSNWKKKYGCCPVSTAEKTQRQRYTDPAARVRADSKATVPRGPVPQ